MDEKEKYVLKFIYMILTDKRNQNRYCSTVLGNMEENKIVGLGDCMEYLENKYQELVKRSDIK